jgi:hypothetical protein
MSYEEEDTCHSALQAEMQDSTLVTHFSHANLSLFL